MGKTSYLMMAVFVGSLAAIMFIQKERIDFDCLWSVLLQKGAQARSEKTDQLQKTVLPENACKGEIKCDSSLSDVPCTADDSSRDAKEVRSKQNNGESECFARDGATTSTKEQQTENGYKYCKGEKANEEQNNDILTGHMKKLGEHGAIIMEGEIEELNFVPNGKDFYEHFLRKRRPLIMRGAIKNWPAVQHWANESYLREKYGEVVFDVQLTKKYEGEFPAKKTMNLDEFLTIYRSKQVYLDCPFPHSDMIKDIFVPYCLQCEEVMPTIANTHLLLSSGNHFHC